MTKLGHVRLGGLISHPDHWKGIEKQFGQDEFARDHIQQTSLPFREYVREARESKLKGGDLLSYMVEGLVDDVVSFLDSNKIDTLVLEGNSLGGKLAIDMATHQQLAPQVQGIILNCSAGLGENLKTGTSHDLRGKIVSIAGTRGRNKQLIKMLGFIDEIVGADVQGAQDKITKIVEGEMDGIESYHILNNDDLIVLADQTLDLLLTGKKIFRLDQVDTQRVVDLISLGKPFVDKDCIDKMTEETRAQLVQIADNDVDSLVIAGLGDPVLDILVLEEQHQKLNTHGKSDYKTYDERAGHIPHIVYPEQYVADTLEFDKRVYNRLYGIE